MTLKELKEKINNLPTEYDNLEVGYVDFGGYVKEIKAVKDRTLVNIVEE